MRPATQKESLPNNVESLIRRLGQELSCSIWYMTIKSFIFVPCCNTLFLLCNFSLSVFENPTMTPCNHTFCKYNNYYFYQNNIFYSLF